MKKLLCFCLTLCLLACILPGCTGDAAEPTQGSTEPQAVLPNIPADYFTCVCENTALEFNWSAPDRIARFQVLSAVPLAADAITVEFDQEARFTTALTMDAEPTPMDSASFAAYQGASWADLAKSGELSKALSDYEAALNALAQERIPRLYSGILAISFDAEQSSEDITLHTLKLTVGGKTYTYDLGTIRVCTRILADYSDGLRADTLCITDMNLHPGTDGTLEIPGIELTATQDVTLDEVCFSDGGAKLLSAGYSQTLPDGQTVNQDIVAGGAVSLTAGDKISVNVLAEVDNAKNTLAANGNLFLIFKYTCGGEQHSATCQIGYRMRLLPLQYYAAAVDGLDIAGYYAA